MTDFITPVKAPNGTIVRVPVYDLLKWKLVAEIEMSTSRGSVLTHVRQQFKLPSTYRARDIVAFLENAFQEARANGAQ